VRDGGSGRPPVLQSSPTVEAARHGGRSKVPFRVGVMQLTSEPVDKILAQARAMDRFGFDTIWLAEAYPWWRKHGLEARSLTAISALVAAQTERIAIGWGIISPYSRHPIAIAMDARVTQETAGPGRFYLGLGASKILMREVGEGERKRARPLVAMRESLEMVRQLLAGSEMNYRGDEFWTVVPALKEEAEATRDSVPIYVAGTGPKIQQLAGEVADGLLTPSITTPDFVRYSKGNLAEGALISGRDAEGLDIGCTLVASIDEDHDKGRDGAREIAAMYLANKVQNIQASADILLQLAGIDRGEIVPVAEAMEAGGRLAAKGRVSDALLDKCKPIAGTPKECIERIEEYREAGCTHIMLELWGGYRERQLELFGKKVLPEVLKDR